MSTSLCFGARFVTGKSAKSLKWGGGEVRDALNPDIAIIGGNKINGVARMSERDAQ